MPVKDDLRTIYLYMEQAVDAWERNDCLPKIPPKASLLKRDFVRLKNDGSYKLTSTADYLEQWGEEEDAKDNLRHLVHQALPPARTSCPAEDLWLEYQTPLPTSLRSGLTAPGCGLCANTGLIVTHGRHPITSAPIQLPCICPNGRALKAKS